jgi:hypothetical protein
LSFVCSLFFVIQASAQSGGSDIWLAKLPANVKSETIAKTDLQWRKVTDEPSYHNQPYFDLNNNRLLYTAMKDGKQTDLFAANLDSLTTVNLTKSAESDYSPTIMPGKTGISGIQVDKRGKQWLWSWSLKGDSKAKLIAAEPIGYHVWLNENEVLVFVLGDGEQPVHTLQRHSLNTDSRVGTTIDEHIGASLWQIPGTELFSYSRMKGEEHQLLSYAPKTNATMLITTLPVPSPYYAWSPDGFAVTPSGEEGKENQLIAWNITGESWQPFIDMSGQCNAGISRLAISSDYGYIAVVCNR